MARPKPAEPTRAYQVRLPATLHRRALQLAAVHDITLSNAIRILLKNWVSTAERIGDLPPDGEPVPAAQGAVCNLILDPDIEAECLSFGKQHDDI